MPKGIPVVNPPRGGELTKNRSGTERNGGAEKKQGEESKVGDHREGHAHQNDKLSKRRYTVVNGKF